MIDPVLNRRLEHCHQLMKAWHNFHQYLTACIKGRNFDEKAEATFLRLKSHIAILHDNFLDAIDSNDRDNAAISQSIITLVERCILLKQVVKMNVAELKKMEMEWHEAYLLINDTIGILEEEINHLGEINHLHHNIERIAKRLKGKTRKITGSNAFKIIIVVGGILGVLVAAPMFDLFSYGALDTGPTQGIYRTVRNLLRGSFTKTLPYIDMLDYEERGQGEMVYGIEANEGFGREIWNKPKPTKNLELFIYKSSEVNTAYVGVEVLDLREEVKDLKDDIDIKCYKYIRNLSQNKELEAIYTLFVIFPSNVQASGVENKIKAWKSEKLPDTGPAADLEEKIMFGRRNNVLYFLYTLNPDTKDINHANNILSVGLRQKMKMNAFE